MPTFTLPRSGQRPLAFEGQLLASADGQTRPNEPTRWHELAAYRTDGGRYVVAITLRTRWQGELDHHVVAHAADPAAIEAVLRDTPPCPPGIGYPPGDAYAERRDRLGADLRRRYDALVTELFAQLGPAFTEVLA